MDDYLNPLINKFKNNKDIVNAEQQKKYLLNKFEFLGLKTPQRKELLKLHKKEYGKPQKEKLKEL